MMSMLRNSCSTSARSWGLRNIQREALPSQTLVLFFILAMAGIPTQAACHSRSLHCRVVPGNPSLEALLQLVVLHTSHRLQGE